MSNRILVIGGNSKIGRPLIKALLSRGDIVFKTSRRENDSEALFLDLLDVDTFLRNDPPYVNSVVFCAAITTFEECRKDPKQAYEVNVAGPARLAAYYANAGAKIIQLSTNAVFNGKTPFVAASTSPNAVNGYGGLKAEAEAEFKKIKGLVSIIRLTKIIIPGENIFANWLSLLQKGEKIMAFKDQYFSPVAIDLAIYALMAVIDDDNEGIYQFSANGDISYFDAAQKMAQIFGVNEELVVATSAAENGIPKDEIFRYNSLDSSRIERLNIKPPDPFAILNHFL